METRLYHTRCYMLIRVSRKQGVLPFEILSHTLNLADFFSFFATTRRPTQLLSVKFDRRKTITLSADVCLQHVDGGAERLAVFVYAPAETVLHRRIHYGWRISREIRTVLSCRAWSNAEVRPVSTIGDYSLRKMRKSWWHLATGGNAVMSPLPPPADRHQTMFVSRLTSWISSCWGNEHHCVVVPHPNQPS